MIKVSNLTQDFTDVRALENVSFEVEEGAVVALIGPNGSGKTTLMRCISTLQEIQEGSIFINEVDITEEPRKIHQMVGYLADNFGLYDDLTVRECLAYTAHSRLLEIDDATELVVDCAKEVGVFDFIDREVNTLSRGMRQRVGIAQAIIHSPKLLILDEPASGLDPEARIDLSNLILKLRERGMTIFVSSHILAELEDYSTEMLIIKNGKIVEHTKLISEKKDALNKTTLKLVLEESFAELSFLLHDLSENVGVIQTEGLEITLSLNESELKQHELLRYLMNNNVPVRELSSVKRNLQEEYLKTIQNN